MKKETKREQGKNRENGKKNVTRPIAAKPLATNCRGWIIDLPACIECRSIAMGKVEESRRESARGGGGRRRRQLDEGEEEENEAEKSTDSQGE